MNTLLKRVVSLGLIAPFLLTGAAYAESSNSGTNEDKVKTNATSTVASDDTATEAGDDKDLSKRLQERKAKLKTAITNVEKTRIQSRCKASQGKFSSLNGRIKGIETSRGEVYTKLTTKLSDLEAKLKAKGADTSALNTQIAALKVKIATYNTDLATYKQAVTDLGSMDCAADPVAFKASLETARAALLTVKQDAVAIHSYVTQTIRPTLQTIKASLETQSTGDN